MPRRVGIDREKQYKRQHQWQNENRDRIYLLAPKGTKERWKEQAEKEGKSLNEYVIDKVESRD